MSDAVATNEEIPVILVGGGLIGLSMSVFLAQHGIPSLAIERLRGGSPLPRAGFFHMRTLEMFRAAGIEDEVRAQSEREFEPEGAVTMMSAIKGKKLADIIPSLNEGVDALSPCRRLFINQPGLEPILRRRALKAGGKLLEGHEVTDIAQDANGVTVTVKNVDDGKESKLRGKYLIGADGAHSKVREALGIPFDGRGVFSNSMTVYFQADCAPDLLGKPLSVIYINNPVLGAFFRFQKDCQSGFLAVNTVGDPKADPVAAANPAADISEKRLIELVRAGIGDDNIPVKIQGVARWRATSDVARTYQQGRIFLAGDAAHLMPPNGGFGGNTGIHDAHNLAWKLALVLKGVASPDLLTSYDVERKPVGKFTVEQAYTRYVTRTAPYLGAKDFQPPASDFNIELGYLYNSPAIVPDESVDDKTHDDPHKTLGRPGSRGAHVWLEQNGRKISTLDLVGTHFVLLAAGQGQAWCDAAREAAKSFKGLELDAYCVGGDVKDPDNRFAEAYGLTSSGAVLVRPDGFVGWRAKAMSANPKQAIDGALRAILRKV